MKTTARLIATVVAATLVSLVLAGVVLAASPSPGLIGGTLSTTGDAVTIESHATMPVQVTFEATAAGVSVTPVTLTLDPNETGHATISGPLVGKVSAHLVQTGPDASGDKAAVTLEVGIKPYIPPFDPTPIGGAALLIAGAAFLLWRVRHVRIHITRSA